MRTPNIFKFLLICFIGFATFACSENEAQQDFETEALQSPSGITEMNASGSQVDDGEEDESDWRTAPNFSGLFEVITPAFPNPVPYNSSFDIQFNIKAIDAVHGLYVYAFQQQNDIATANPLEVRQGTLQPGITSIRISPQKFARGSGTGTFGNTYRIIIYDNRQTVITYGDVIVE